MQTKGSPLTYGHRMLYIDDHAKYSSEIGPHDHGDTDCDTKCTW